jgi:hypothetical protein
MRRYALIFAGLAAALTVAACSDTGGPRGPQESGLESVPGADALQAPTAEEGVVPDVVLVLAVDAAEVVKEAGYKPVLDSISIVTDQPPDEDDLVCEQNPELSWSGCGAVLMSLWPPQREDQAKLDASLTGARGGHSADACRRQEDRGRPPLRQVRG